MPTIKYDVTDYILSLIIADNIRNGHPLDKDLIKALKKRFDNLSSNDDMSVINILLKCNSKRGDILN